MGAIDMKVLITGINGFIGYHLSKKLIERGYLVSGLKNEGGGVLNKKKVERAVSEANIVVHLAGLTSHDDINKNKIKTLETNIFGTKNILDAFINSKKEKKFIFPSTGKVYGKISYLPLNEEHPTNPLNILGKSKLMTEKLIDFYASVLPNSSKKEFIIFRIFNVYGQRQERFLIPTIISQLKSTNKIILGDIISKRDYIHIDDVVNAFISVIEKKSSPGLSIYNICSGNSLSASDIVKLVEKIKRIKISVKVGRKLLRQDEEKDEYGSYEKAKRDFKWKPRITITEGLKKLL